MKDGKYREALGKWETALNLMPENAVLLEQKAQVLLELGDSWSALKAATRKFHFLFHSCFWMQFSVTCILVTLFNCLFDLKFLRQDD